MTTLQKRGDAAPGSREVARPPKAATLRDPGEPRPQGTSHTPGSVKRLHAPAPWRVDSSGILLGADWPRDIPVGRVNLDKCDGVANALLLESAPELLDVLRRLVAECGPDRGEKLRADRVWNELLCEAGAAIAKAEGGGR